MGEGLAGGGREEVLLWAVCPSALVRRGGIHMLAMRVLANGGYSHSDK